jgi:hypothetical protein
MAEHEIFSTIPNNAVFNADVGSRYAPTARKLGEFRSRRSIELVPEERAHPDRAHLGTVRPGHERAPLTELP